ncbi:MAG TPA: serine/threonine-protein kinase [Gemmatimonadaceae bacterium]|nr:serine/threonine-protein kinase [Gemmatimonadaceae bacterium]
MAELRERLQSGLTGRYHVERELGRGGMATVYLARDLLQDSTVAMKVLDPDLAVALGPERFRREIQLATHLTHPNILPVYEAGDAEGSLFYTMPFVDGESLRQRLAREHQLSIDDAVDITCEVAAGLECAHRHGVIHRDIKPENILLADGHAIVADFGIARAVTAVGDDQLTQSGITLGTPTYMSPEQAAADRHLDARSDIYSLGCVLYEMLAGQPPFVGATAHSIIARHTLDQVPSLSIIRDTVPPHVEDAVLRALEKVPADRFRTAAEFAEALRAPTRSTGTRWTGSRAAPPPATRERSALTRRRIVFASLVLLVLAGSGWTAWHQWHRALPMYARGTTSGADPRRIAVLYFQDETPDKHLGYLADGLTEALIGRLSGVQALDVTSRNGSALYRHSTASPDSIARALSVGTLVDGSIEQSGNRVQVTVKLEDASGADFRRTTFAAPVTQTLALRDTLAARIADFLRQRLGDEIQLRADREGTRNPDAWALVQRARLASKDADSLAEHGDSSRAMQAFGSADSLLARAATLDRRWVEPPLMRGTVAYRRSRLVTQPLQIAAWIDTGLAFAQRALALDPNSPDALELRGTLHYWRHLNDLAPDPREDSALVQSAEHDLRAAVEIAPSQASAWSVLAHLDFNRADPVDGLLASRKALDEDAYLSAAPDILWRLYGGSFELEKFTDAAYYCGTGRHRFPDNPRFVLCHLYLLAANGETPDVARAWRLVDTLHTLTPASEWAFQGREAQMLVAGVLARAGQADSARHLLVRARADASIDPGRDLWGDEAWIRTILGDKTEAIDLLKRYLAANPQHRAGMATNENWQWRDLRGDPRYQALVGTGR